MVIPDVAKMDDAEKLTQNPQDLVIFKKVGRNSSVILTACVDYAKKFDGDVLI